MPKGKILVKIQASGDPHSPFWHHVGRQVPVKQEPVLEIGKIKPFLCPVPAFGPEYLFTPVARIKGPAVGKHKSCHRTHVFTSAAHNLAGIEIRNGFQVMNGCKRCQGMILFDVSGFPRCQGRTECPIISGISEQVTRTSARFSKARTIERFRHAPP